MFAPTLLITDDDAAFRETLRDVFEPEGFRTVLADDGQEAFEIVKSESIHLALLDMHMPKMDGVTTIRLVHELRPELPCILLSAALDDMIVKAAQEVLAFSILHKPCSKKQITSIVQKAIRVTYQF